MVDGSYSQFKATKGRKAARDFKKDQYDRKKLYFNSSVAKVESNEKRFSQEEIEATKARMRQKIARDRRKSLIILLSIIALLTFMIILILK